MARYGFFLLSNTFCLAGSAALFDMEGITNSFANSSVNDKYNMNMLFGKKDSKKDSGVTDASDSGLNYEKLHRYLGYTTLVLAGLTAVTSGNKDVHYGAAYGTVGAALGTLFSGYLAHGDRFNLKDGLFTEDNNHILLGTIGAIGCIAAVALADSGGGNSHDGIGIFGGTAMALSVITIRW